MLVPEVDDLDLRVELNPSLAFHPPERLTRRAEHAPSPGRLLCCLVTHDARVPEAAQSKKKIRRVRACGMPEPGDGRDRASPMHPDGVASVFDTARLATRRRGERGESKATHGTLA